MYNYIFFVVILAIIILFLVYISQITYVKEKNCHLTGISSHDFFDTLGSRRLLSDVNNFKFIQQQECLPVSFVKDRLKTPPGTTLSEKYDYLHTKKGYSLSLCDRLMKAEQRVELDNIFPIVQNVKRVKAGDYIISDTEYDAQFMRELLDKCGVPKDVAIVVTPNGKEKGTVWNSVSDAGITRHFGDNLKSDTTCRKYGIKPFIHTFQKTTVLEKYIRERYPILTACIIEGRLRNPYDNDDPHYWLWRGQCEYNFPILLLFARYLDIWCTENSVKNVKCMLRDCCLFYRLFKALYGDKYNIDLIYCSRHSLKNAQGETLEYFRKHSGEKNGDTVMIDGQGKGTSFLQFYKDHPDIPKPHNMNIFRYWSGQQVSNVSAKYMPCRFRKWLKNMPVTFDPRKEKYLCQMMDNRWDDFIEMFNMDVNGSFIGFDEKGKGKPLLKPLTYKKEVAHVGHDCFDLLQNIYVKHHWKRDNTIKTLSKTQIVDLVDKISKNCHNTEEYWKTRQRYHSVS